MHLGRSRTVWAQERLGGGRDDFKRHYQVMMESAADEQDKLPDMVFKYADEFYIVEMKNMKGGGGGQNKQIVEVINFIRYAEQNRHVHYVTFLDGEYSNLLHKSQQRKIRLQREDIVGCLTRNPGNYFVNTAGFKALLDSLSAPGR